MAPVRIWEVMLQSVLVHFQELGFELNSVAVGAGRDGGGVHSELGHGLRNLIRITGSDSLPQLRGKAGSDINALVAGGFEVAEVAGEGFVAQGGDVEHLLRGHVAGLVEQAFDHDCDFRRECLAAVVPPGRLCRFTGIATAEARDGGEIVTGSEGRRGKVDRAQDGAKDAQHSVWRGFTQSSPQHEMHGG